MSNRNGSTLLCLRVRRMCPSIMVGLILNCVERENQPASTPYGITFRLTLSRISVDCNLCIWPIGVAFSEHNFVLHRTSNITILSRRWCPFHTEKRIVHSSFWMSIWQKPERIWKKIDCKRKTLNLMRLIFYLFSMAIDGEQHRNAFFCLRHNSTFIVHLY